MNQLQNISKIGFTNFLLTIVNGFIVKVQSVSWNISGPTSIISRLPLRNTLRVLASNQGFETYNVPKTSVETLRTDFVKI